MRIFRFLFLTCLFIPASYAADVASVTHAWVRLPPPGAKIAAAYLTLESKHALSLVSVSSPAAQSVEIHSMSMQNEVMEMRQLDVLEIPAGKPIKLEPGGLHLMLIDLKKPLKAGDTVKLSLRFKQSKQRLYVHAPVQASAP